MTPAPKEPQMAQEMIERVATALFAKEHENLEGWTWEKETADPSKRAYWMESARAAIAALRPWLREDAIASIDSN